jgi:hypothetical protein
MPGALARKKSLPAERKSGEGFFYNPETEFSTVGHRYLANGMTQISMAGT